MRSISDIYESHRLAFERHTALLKRWNEKINLTAITDPEQIRKKHFLDSLAAVGAIEEFMKNVSRETLHRTAQCGAHPIRLLDIGSGGGFPGLPLKIAFPEIEVTLIDAVKKKCDFMKAAARELELKDVKVIHLKLDAQTKLDDKFDVVISRAAFSLKDFFALALPQRKESGVVIAMKSGDVDKDSGELKEASPLIEQHGLKLKIEPYQIETSEPVRNLIIISPF